MILIGLCKYFRIFFLLFSFYFTSTLNLSLFYHNSTSQISVPYSAIRAPYSTIRVPYSAIRVSVCSSPSSVFIPKVGTLHSQGGNNCCPSWEFRAALTGTTPHVLSIQQNRSRRLVDDKQRFSRCYIEVIQNIYGFIISHKMLIL